MFQETKNNWITGEHNIFENIIWTIIFLYLVVTVIAIYGAFNKGEGTPIQNTSVPIESSEIQNYEEIQMNDYEPKAAEQSTPINANQMNNSYVPANTVKVINQTEEREKRKEQRAIERAERKQQRLENRLQRQQEREEKRLEKQRLKEEKRQERLNRNNQNAVLENPIENYSAEDSVSQEIPEE